MLSVLFYQNDATNSKCNFIFSTKERRTSFEGFIPDGILRANWMWRHYNEIPSSIAIFFDWSEDDPEWRQKEGDLCIKLENVRFVSVCPTTKLQTFLILRHITLIILHMKFVFKGNKQRLAISNMLLFL
jgi:hypothetical protein